MRPDRLANALSQQLRPPSLPVRAEAEAKMPSSRVESSFKDGEVASHVVGFFFCCFVFLKGCARLGCAGWQLYGTSETGVWAKHCYHGNLGTPC